MKEIFKIIKLRVVTVLGFLGLILITTIILAMVSRPAGPGLQDFEIDLTDTCILSRNSTHDIYIQCDGISGRVNPKVVKLGWDTNFVVAMTNPVTKKVYPNNPNNTYRIPDENVTYWWVIDIRKKVLYGPLKKKSSYEIKRAELAVSADVILLPLDEIKK